MSDSDGTCRACARRRGVPSVVRLSRRPGARARGSRTRNSPFGLKQRACVPAGPPRHGTPGCIGVSAHLPSVTPQPPRRCAMSEPGHGSVRGRGGDGRAHGGARGHLGGRTGASPQGRSVLFEPEGRVARFERRGGQAQVERAAGDHPSPPRPRTWNGLIVVAGRRGPDAAAASRSAGRGPFCGRGASRSGCGRRFAAA